LAKGEGKVRPSGEKRKKEKHTTCGGRKKREERRTCVPTSGLKKKKKKRKFGWEKRGRTVPLNNPYFLGKKEGEKRGEKPLDSSAHASGGEKSVGGGKSRWLPPSRQRWREKEGEKRGKG